MRLKNKVAVVTGVANPKGIGFESAKMLAREGARLAVADISEKVHERADELKTAGYNVISFQLDLTDSEKVNNMTKKVIAKYGKVDILVNAAGTVPNPRVPKLFIDLTEEEWDKEWANNLKTTFNCTQAVLPNMIKRRYGKIVNIASVVACHGAGSVAGTTAYSAAKYGVVGFTHNLALNVARHGINANTILAGWIDTGLFDRGVYEERVKSIPLGRNGSPEDIAYLVLFLSSDESSYLTGSDIVIDGGNMRQELRRVPPMEPFPIFTL
ncbi:MAG: SDR family oxidoreductase [Candidatus Bathyarchaeota archaeon]|nr:MAG: SDR family oxidoreductase [Candidatus Bathyarchaeota archaeon]